MKNVKPKTKILHQVILKLLSRLRFDVNTTWARDNNDAYSCILKPLHSRKTLDKEQAKDSIFIADRKKMAQFDESVF